LLRGAPHKPLLLLALTKLIGAGTVSSNFVPPSPELELEFNKLWDAILQGRRGSMAGPFLHLRNDVTDQGHHIWTLVPSTPGDEIDRINDLRSVTGLRARVSGAKMLGGLFENLSDVRGRMTLQSVLLETYFGESARDVLRRSLGVREA
jgi:putative restriction endonuclease